jgi:hypothetical protein
LLGDLLVPGAGCCHSNDHSRRQANVTATANPTTGVPNPDKPDWWIVPPWEAGASFCDVVRHFLRFDPWWGGASSGHQLAYYTAYLTALETAPTSELTHATSLAGRDELLDCVRECIAIFRQQATGNIRQLQAGAPATIPTPIRRERAS